MLLPTGMANYFCPEQCKSLCSGAKCDSSQRWVEAFHQDAYRVGNGKVVPAKDVPGHCEKTTPADKTWIAKLLDGKPSTWRPGEKVSKWTAEQRERVLAALREIPDFLKDPNIFGIFRMKDSETPNNPASSDYSDIVLYDRAFSDKENLTQVLEHEMAHRLFDKLPKSEQDDFRNVGQWEENPQKPGTFLRGREKGGFVRENDMANPEEDFADGIVTFLNDPEKLKRTAPRVYRWMKDHYGSVSRGKK